MGVLTIKGVAGKIREARGNLAAVGRAFAVTRQAVYQFVRDKPDLMAVCMECRETVKDDVESSLYDAALAGDPWAVQFYLKTQARDRGYTDTHSHEHSGPGGTPITTIIIGSIGTPSPFVEDKPDAPATG